MKTPIATASRAASADRTMAVGVPPRGGEAPLSPPDWAEVGPDGLAVEVGVAAAGLAVEVGVAGGAADGPPPGVGGLLCIGGGVLVGRGATVGLGAGTLGVTLKEVCQTILPCWMALTASVPA